MQIIKKLLGLNYFVSELDQFLAELDQKYPKPSASQRYERDKYARIYRLRDGLASREKTSNLWEHF